ncbi:MAG: hypothetical protein HYY93_13170 [Planctomycetes bacterium]|nr:hypothetical protein [Planctomycetota bacterium]
MNRACTACRSARLEEAFPPWGPMGAILFPSETGWARVIPCKASFSSKFGSGSTPPLTTTVCLDCGHLDHWTDPERFRRVPRSK